MRKISFTGSTRVGRILMDGASRTFTRLALELGGNAPVIILLEAEEFAEKSAQRVSGLKIGNGLEADTNVGPMINAIQLARVEALVGGERPAEFDKGYFFQPTVLANDPLCRCGRSYPTGKRYALWAGGLHLH